MARVGASLLAACGHPEWTAATDCEYVAHAVGLAKDPARLATVRASLRAGLQRSPLLDHTGQAARFGRALRECWQAWCRSRGPATSPALTPASEPDAVQLAPAR
jgi:predicted O-linked N-acetylglucosamine transferase (SPINDLY family)